MVAIVAAKNVSTSANTDTGVSFHHAAKRHLHQATTTLYKQPTGGACGCFDNYEHRNGFKAQFGFSGIHFAAGSASIFDPKGEHTWCGSGCGTCFRLKSTGHAACQTCGTGSARGLTITVVVYDLCPAGTEPNSEQYHYCSPKGVSNSHGFKYHFDIHSSDFTVGGHKWDNPVVDFEPIKCPQVVTNWLERHCKKCTQKR
ncbi:RlpA-like double-psi beta-barrel-protein domain-containing protein-containing protein [Protomyces lactucae-debilis]|uniref:RlpA-like double-psi beta-barrel-protein domain-containing protein-containing protein n=1 Tax=Protomyces lactucae-debilis TaxID=2754530 RepID=A0A1Y2F7I6_PROLT|nr:RlpA-like double-psi beta-barrel-protein domain-containing protein-containing protein [Protomyces lactucae-debilis]ORY79843.1 RlpA-like double-psi beta-barrel-protein domain-containing protein-containing protein [Protomyces lactucae-debilis]